MSDPPHKDNNGNNSDPSKSQKSLDEIKAEARIHGFYGPTNNESSKKKRAYPPPPLPPTNGKLGYPPPYPGYPPPYYFPGYPPFPPPPPPPHPVAAAASAAAMAAYHAQYAQSMATAYAQQQQQQQAAPQPTTTKANFWNKDYAKFKQIMQGKATPDDDDDDDDNEDHEYREGEEEEEADSEEEESDPEPAARDNDADPPPPDDEDMDLSPLDFFNDDNELVKELQEELGWLQDEEMEAAVATLLQDALPKPDEAPGTPVNTETWPHNTPLRGQAAAKKKTPHLTAAQFATLEDLMKKHYQLLLQQAVLSIRAAHAQKYQNRNLQRIITTVSDKEDDATKKRKYAAAFWMGHESSEELMECLDGAVGMLMDLDQNRKDAFRDFVQSAPTTGRLTRTKFQQSLQELSQGTAQTVFDIPGISTLSETYNFMDGCVQADENESHFILETESTEAACKFVLDRSKCVYDASIVPGVRDLSYNFTNPKEYCGEDFKPPCNATDDLLFRRNRNLFSAGEDNLVLRGVNLYGEKQWNLIAGRYLPERSIHVISQRYNKVCMMIYMANGVKIDEQGRLEKPAVVSEEMTAKQSAFLDKLEPLHPPAILNVHRWSLKEDLMLLKSVPVLGNCWAKLGSSLIPYRDRGHLRKRYQVLERRVKSTMSRANRKEFLEVLNQRTWGTSGGPRAVPKPARLKASSPAKIRPSPAPSASGPPQAPPTQPPAYPGYPAPAFSPYPYPPPYPPAAYPYPPPSYTNNDEQSRIAFEKLAQESKGEWSQMSYMQNVLMSPPRTGQAGASAKTDGEGSKASGQPGSLLGNVLQKTGEEKTAAAAGTPIKGTVFSTNGSPIGLGDHFRSSPGGPFAESHLPGFQGVPFGSATMQSFPATSRLSAGESSGHSPPANLGPEHSLDSLATYHSAYTRAARPLFSGDTLHETDLEAASALNILSNSPGLKKRKKDEEDGGGAKPKSLFDKVVGGGGDQSSKKTKQRQK